MKSVLLLGRAKRLAPLFTETARELATDRRVILTIGTVGNSIDEKEFGLPPDHPNIEVYRLPEEIKRHYAEFVASGRPVGPLLRTIESETGLTLYRSASNYLVYRRFAYDYYGTFDTPYDDEAEYIAEYVGSYLFFKKLFDKHSPELGFCETPDQPSHRLAMAMLHQRDAHATGIFLSSTFGKGRAILTSGANRRSVLLDHFYANPSRINPESLTAAQATLDTYRNKGIVEADYYGVLRARSQAGFLSRLSTKRLKAFLERDHRLTAITKQLEMVGHIRWLDHHFKRKLPDYPYILFCLHHQPEAATSMVAPRWIDQDRIVEQLALVAPSGLKIVVKENPKTYGLRGKRYFEYLARFPNVHLLHPGVAQDEAIRNASAVLAISGTTGIESILMRKKVGILSTCFYSAYKGARFLEHPADLFAHLEDPSWRPEDDESGLLRFAAAAYQATFPLGKPQAGFHWPPPEQSGPNLARAIRSYIETGARDAIRPRDYTIQV